MHVLGKIALAVGRPDDALAWFRRGAEREHPLCLRELGARVLYANHDNGRGWGDVVQVRCRLVGWLVGRADGFRQRVVLLLLTADHVHVRLAVFH